MTQQDRDVAAWLAAFEHPMCTELSALRAAILTSDAAIGERIKWSAPSFTHGGDDRVTVRVPPKGTGLQLIFHRGAKVKDTSGFTFEDSSGLLAWPAPDCGVLTLASAAEAKARRGEVVALVGAWMAATGGAAAASAPTKPPAKVTKATPKPGAKRAPRKTPAPR